jgi:hypothetical protein
MAEKKGPAFETPQQAPVGAPTPAPAPPQPQQTQAQAQQNAQAAKPKKLRTTIGDKKIVATRTSRQGDDGYQLSTPDDQVTVIFEDGSDKVVKSDALYE